MKRDTIQHNKGIELLKDDGGFPCVDVYFGIESIINIKLGLANKSSLRV
ncbi:MAG: hypothetical protein ACOYEJ_07370 [Mahellales bacterium]|jgi:hypothetical protein